MMTLHRWSLAVNDFLGIPHSGWGEDFPSVGILLAAMVMAWVLWVSVSLADRGKE